MTQHSEKSKASVQQRRSPMQATRKTLFPATAQPAIAAVDRRRKSAQQMAEVAPIAAKKPQSSTLYAKTAGTSARASQNPTANSSNLTNFKKQGSETIGSLNIVDKLQFQEFQFIMFDLIVYFHKTILIVVRERDYNGIRLVSLQAGRLRVGSFAFI